ncbi:MAG: restriction endonuclease subunit S, partial [Chlorobiota bacterium]
MTQRYSAYKDSGVEWIGEVPEHWEVTRISNLGYFYKGNGIKKDEVRLEGLPCIRYGEIYTTYDRIVSSVRSFIDKVTAEESVQGFKGDILFAGSGETIEDIGKAVLYFGDEPVYIGGDIIVLRSTQVANSLFLSYVVNSHYVQHQKSIVGKGEIVVHIYSKSIRDIRIALPPAIEQSQIVEFLDAKTSLIDRLIDVKQRRIELLKEKRATLINNAVTKGLDPNVKMKDSGIEWIGEIPEHWEVKKMKYGVSNPSIKTLPAEGQIKISPENVESDTGVCINFYSDYEGEGFQFVTGDILFNKLRIYLKKILFADFDGISMGEMIVLRCNDTLH